MTLFSLLSRLGLALVALMGAWLLWPALRDNVAHRQALLALDIAQRSRSVDETAWEEGWGSLCPTAVTGERETAVPNPFTALALLDRGDYPQAARQFAALSPAEYANAPAYAAALEQWQLEDSANEQVSRWLALYRPERETVLNQVANGSFAWDAPPDGLRPFGWYGNLYSTGLSGIEYRP